MRRVWRRVWSGLVGTARENRRILLLLPLLVLLSLLFLWQGKPRFEQSFTLYADRVLDLESSGPRYAKQRDKQSKADTDSTYRRDDAKQKRAAKRDTLFLFDPNTVSLEELVRLGFTERQAAVIGNYRKAGAVFRKPSDFARCYTVSEEMYRRLEHFIRIDSTRFERRTEQSPKRTPKDDQTKPLVVNDTVSTERESSVGPQKDSVRIELNGADSATLVGVRGIGPLTAGRIVRYRERLGGFVRVEQLLEVRGMLEKNYQQILPQIWVDSSKIQKIDINFALPFEIGMHPYMTEQILNRLMKYRQLKGGWRSIGDLTEQNILSKGQAERLAPYLCFEEK